LAGHPAINSTLYNTENGTFMKLFAMDITDQINIKIINLQNDGFECDKDFLESLGLAGEASGEAAWAADDLVPDEIAPICDDPSSSSESTYF
jgi:hypothetical protein